MLATLKGPRLLSELLRESQWSLSPAEPTLPEQKKRTRNRAAPVQDRILRLAHDHNVSASSPQELLNGVAPHWGDAKKHGSVPAQKTFKRAFAKFQNLRSPYSP
jgi:hypothetical protein